MTTPPRDTPQGWQPIETAPKDGTLFIGRKREIINRLTQAGPRGCVGEIRYLRRVTWWGKVSHVTLYGWCYGHVEDVDTWNPTEWQPVPPPKGKEAT